MMAVWRRSVLFPPWFGPVMMCRRVEGSMCVVLGVKGREVDWRDDSTVG
jgi:hypothetical protein